MVKEILKLKVKGSNQYIDYIIDTKTGKMTTDETIFGDNMEIIFSNDKQMYQLKNYNIIKSRYLKKQGKPTNDLDNTIKRSIELL